MLDPNPTADFPDRSIQPGMCIGEYKVLSVLGEGGFGVVYLAECERPVKRRVALKVIKPGMDSRQIVARFDAERQALALMDHPHVAKVFDAGMTESGTSYFVMEFIKGIPINEHCDRQKLPIADRLRLFIDVCEAIQHAHQKGIIHRDLKPRNILVALEGNRATCKVIDFGVAKAIGGPLTEQTLYTEQGQIIGTPEYMSPEQAEMTHQDIDTRTDIYALGVVLYELLTGSLPFSADYLRKGGIDHLRQVIREEEPQTPSTRITSLAAPHAMQLTNARQIELRELQRELKGDLDWIALKAMEKNRQRRYETANGLAMDIRRYLSDEPILARPPSALYRFSKMARRNRAVFVATAVVATALVVGLAAALWGLSKANSERARAETAEREAERQRDDALQARQIAIQESQAADAARQTAEHAREAAEAARYLEMVTRLAAQSQSMHTQSPIRSALLAIEAVEMTRKHDQTILPIAHEALLNAVPLLGGKPLIGHEASIESMTISPDGRWLATGSSDGTTRLWDLHAGDPSSSARDFGEHLGSIDAVAISPDGRWLVTGSADKTARVWDLHAEDPVASPRVLDGHEAGILSVAFSADGHWLATGADDGTARLWDFTADDPASSARILPGQEECGYRVAFSRNGRWLLTIPIWGGSMPLLWDLTAEDPKARPLVLRGNKDTIRSSKIGPDGRWLFTADRDKALLWDLTDDDPAFSARTWTKEWILASEISPSGRWLVTGGGTVHLRDLTADEPVSTARELPGHTHFIGAVAISADSRWLVTGSGDMTARLWDLEAKDPETTAIILRGNDAAVKMVGISSDSRWLVTVAAESNTPRLWDLDAVRIWHAKSDQPAGSSLVLPGPGKRIWHMAASDDGHWLVTPGDDDTARVWDLTAPNPASSLRVLHGHLGEVRSVAIDENGSSVVTGSADRTSRLWDMTARDLSSAVIATEQEQEVKSVAIGPQGRWVATGWSDGAVRLWDRKAGAADSARHPWRGHLGGVSSSVISRNGRWLVTASKDDHLPRLWDLRAEDPLSSPRVLTGHTLSPTGDGIWSVAISSDSRWLLTGSLDTTARLWDLSVENPSTESRVFPAGGGIFEVAIGPNRRSLFASLFGNVKNSLWILNPPDHAARQHRLRANGAQSAAISPDGRWLATGTTNQIAYLMDLNSEDPVSSTRMLRGHLGTVWSLTFSGDSRWLVTSDDEGTIRLWDLDLDRLLERARRGAARELTAEERKQYMLE